MSVRPVVQVIQTRASASVSQPRSVVVKVPGPQGPKGDTGADSTVPGPTGPQGPQGIQGIQGIQGEKGDKGDTGEGVPTPVGTDGQVVTAASGVAVWDDPAVQSVNGATGVVTLDTDDVAESTVNKYVRIFADSSARDAALMSPLEGLITYLEDTNAVEVMDGNAWVSVGGSGFDSVATITATNASWTVPTLADPVVRVTVVGGGGGAGTRHVAGQAGGNGSQGGTTTFNAGGAGTVTATGGLGGKGGTPGSASGVTGTAGLASHNGGSSNTSDDGGRAPTTGGGGNGGQIKVAYLDLTGVSTVNVTIGAGGNGGAGATTTAKGGRGEVIVEYRAG